MAHVRQSRPDSGPGLKVEVRKMLFYCLLFAGKPTSVQAIPSISSSTFPRSIRCRANMAHIRESRPDSGLGFGVKVRKPFLIVPTLLGWLIKATPPPPRSPPSNSPPAATRNVTPKTTTVCDTSESMRGEQLGGEPQCKPYRAPRLPGPSARP